MNARTRVAAAALAAAAFLTVLTVVRGGDPLAQLLLPADPAEVTSTYLAILACFEEDEGSAQPTACKDRVARNEIARTSPAAVEAALNRGLEEHPDLFGPACHSFSHLAGQHAAASLRHLDDLAAIAGRSTDICQFGMYHGLVEGYADRLPAGRLRSELPRLCGVLQDAGTFGRARIEYAEGECNHVLGHVAARATNDHVPSGLQMCGTLTYESARTACGTGVIMNWTDSVHRWSTSGRPDPAPTYLPVSADRRWEICLHVEDRHQAPCALWMGSATVHSPDPDHIRDALAGYTVWCAESFRDPAVVEACWMSVGMMGGDIATRTYLGGWSGVLPLCTGDAPASFLDACLSQLMGVAVSFLTEEEMLSVCDLPGTSAAVCDRAFEALRESFVDSP